MVLPTVGFLPTRSTTESAYYRVGLLLSRPTAESAYYRVGLQPSRPPTKSASYQVGLLPNRLPTKGILGEVRDTYTDIVFKFNSSRRVKFHFLQSLANDIVWLSLRLLRCFDCRRFVDIALVIYVKLTEGIRQAEELVLLELRKLPTDRSVAASRLLPLY